MTLAEQILAAGADAPDRLAISRVSLSRADRWSHARLRRAVLGTTTGFLKAGLRPGDGVLVRMEAGPEAIVALLGAIVAGIRPLPERHAVTAGEIPPRALITDSATLVPDTGLGVIGPEELARFRMLPEATISVCAPDSHSLMTGGTAPLVGPQDRLLHIAGPDWLATAGKALLAPLAAGAAILMPAATLGPEHMPLVAARHGATVVAAPAGGFRGMLGADWKPWSGLHHGLMLSGDADRSLAGNWLSRTGTPLYHAEPG